MNMVLSVLINGTVSGVALTGIAWLFLRLIPRTALNAATRYVGLWALLLIVLLLPALFLPRTLLVGHASGRPIPAPLAVSHAAAQLPIAEPDETPTAMHVHSAPVKTPTIPFAVSGGRWSAVILIGWALAALLMLIRLIISWTILERRKARSLPPPDHFADRASAWLAQCHSARKVTLRMASADIGGPMATGPWNPSILFPARFFDEFPESEIDQIGLHEAAHLARHDDYALAIQRVIEAFFFWHPAIQWITRQINLEREIGCDDFVIQLTGVPRGYASCLTRVAELTAGIRPSLAAAAVTDESSHLATRVEMLLDKTRHTGTRLLKVPLSAGLAALVFLAGMATELPVLFSPVLTMAAAAPVRALAQNQASPPAAPTGKVIPGVVTAGPAAPGTPGSPLPKAVRPATAPTPSADGGVNAELKSAPRFSTATITPVEWHMGGVSTNAEPGKIEYKMMGIKRLFFLAWPIEYYRFVWPAWLTESNGNINAWYDISVTMPAETTPEQLQLMIQGLLADRFKMSAHWETQNMNIYALKIAPGGIKFQKSADPSSPGFRGIGSQDGWHTVPRLPRQPGTASGMTMAQFTQDGSMPGLLDRTLVDRTGLEGVYDIDLSVPRDPNTPWPMQPLRGPATPSDRARNEGFRSEVFFDAVEKQLGLTVSPETAPVKMLTIDNLDVVPTGN